MACLQTKVGQLEAPLKKAAKGRERRKATLKVDASNEVVQAWEVSGFRPAGYRPLDAKPDVLALAVE